LAWKLWEFSEIMNYLQKDCNFSTFVYFYKQNHPLFRILAHRFLFLNVYNWYQNTKKIWKLSENSPVRNDTSIRPRNDDNSTSHRNSSVSHQFESIAILTEFWHYFVHCPTIICSVPLANYTGYVTHPINSLRGMERIIVGSVLCYQYKSIAILTFFDTISVNHSVK